MSTSCDMDRLLTYVCTKEFCFTTIPMKNTFVLHRPLWCTTRVGDDEQDALNLLVHKSVLHLPCVWQSQFPLSHRGVASYGYPATAIAIAGAYNAIDRGSCAADTSCTSRFGETQAVHRHFE